MMGENPWPTLTADLRSPEQPRAAAPRQHLLKAESLFLVFHVYVLGVDYAFIFLGLAICSRG
jgi:hypothetical protein